MKKVGKHILSSWLVLLYLQLFCKCIKFPFTLVFQLPAPTPKRFMQPVWSRAEEEEVKWGGAVYRHFIAVTH